MICLKKRQGESLPLKENYAFLINLLNQIFKIMTKILVITIMMINGPTFVPPLIPTSGAMIPPNINWNNPSKLEAFPLPPDLSSMAKANPTGPIPVTGQTMIKK